MNKERVLAVASAIENRSIKDLGFNMARFLTLEENGDIGEYPDHTGRGCGTTACIAGWAYVLMNGGVLPIDPYLISLNAANWLDLDLAQGVNLFYAHARGDVRMSELTDTEAIKTLRHLAETGIVDWKLS